MKLIKSSVKLLPYADTSEEILRRIEYGTRLCYKSEDKIKKGSAEILIDKILNLKHLSVLEHGSIILSVSNQIYGWVSQQNPKFLNLSSYETTYIISGNIRAWKEFIELYDIENCKIAQELYMFLTTQLPVIFPLDKERSFPIPLSIQRMSYQDIKEYPQDIYEKHLCLSAHFITSRDVSHQLVRSRLASFSQTSQRYVNYSKSKFGKRITFIEPSWFKKGNSENSEFLLFLQQSEDLYLKLIESGWKAEQARVILPNCTMTEVLITASLKGWNYIFKLRRSQKAYSEIRILMDKLYKQIRKVL